MKNCIFIFFIAFSMVLQAQNFEHLKPFEEALAETDRYNMSSVVEGDDALYFTYRVGGPDYLNANRFQLAKTDLEGNTIFHKEILAPSGVNFSWGFNHATPPPMAYAEDRIAVVLPATTTAPPYTPYLFQFIFDTNGNLITQNVLESTFIQEYSNIKATTDGFVFISSEAFVDAPPDFPASLHLFKSDFDGNILWQRQYQFTGEDNIIYARNLCFDSSGNIYVALVHFTTEPGEYYGAALFKFDSNGALVFLKHYIDESNYSGDIRNISMSFNAHNMEEELYMMCSWLSVINTQRCDLFKINTEGELQISKQLEGIEYGTALTTMNQKPGCTVLIGKENNDGITNSFENSGDPILVNFDSNLEINWTYAYGGEDFHFSDDMIATKDNSYLILARSNTEEYLIKTDEDGASVCETVSPNLNPEDIEITVTDEGAIELDYPMDLNEDMPLCVIVNVPFYDQDDKCCPGGVPEVSFSYTYSNATGIINFENTTTNGDSFNWSFDDGTYSYDTNPEHEYLSNGVYEVCLSSENECGTAFYCEEITLESIGIYESSEAGTRIHTHKNGIDVSSPNGTTVILYNSLGQIVFEKENTNGLTRIHTQKPGIYFCQVLSNARVIATQKIIL